MSVTADSIREGMGGMVLPVDLAQVEDDKTLVSLDPLSSILAGLFKAAINSEFGPAWRQVIGPPHASFGQDPVADTLELEPTPAIMQQRKAGYPLLCVHRDGEATFDLVTLEQRRKTQSWAVHYILGPLDVAGQRKLGALTVAVSNLINAVVERRGHPAYRGGELQFFAGRGDLASIFVTSVLGPGTARLEGDDPQAPAYYAITVQLETTELSRDNPEGEGDFDAFDMTLAVGTATAVQPAVIQADSSTPYQAP